MSETFVFDSNDYNKQHLLRVSKVQDRYIIPASVKTIVDGTIDSYAFKVAYRSCLHYHLLKTVKSQPLDLIPSMIVICYQQLILLLQQNSSQ